MSTPTIADNVMDRRTEIDPVIPLASSVFLSAPLEIVDHIIDKVDHPRDLISLARTCKPLYPRIVPSHSQWRVLQLSLDVAFLPAWEYLASSEFCAKNVRVLKIIHPTFLREYHHRKSCLPTLIQTAMADEESKEAEHATKSAEEALSRKEAQKRAIRELVPKFLTLCKGLEKIVWAANFRGDMGPGDKFWPALEGCRRLRSVEVRECCSYDTPSSIWDSATYDLTYLHEFVYTSNILWVKPESCYSLSRASKMLSRSPDLVSLSLELVAEDRDTAVFTNQLLLAGRWPNLRKLHLVAPEGCSLIAAAFFQAHPSIESLSLGTGSLSVSFDQPSRPILPRLRCFQGNAIQFTSLFGHTNSTITRPLEEIFIIRSTRHYGCGNARDMMIPTLLSQMPAIICFTDTMTESVHMPAFPLPEHFALLTQALPNVRKFSLPNICLQVHDDEDGWVKAFSYLRRVETLMVAGRGGGTRGWTYDFALRLALICPHLSRIVSSLFPDGCWTINREAGLVIVQQQN